MIDPRNSIEPPKNFRKVRVLQNFAVPDFCVADCGAVITKSGFCEGLQS